MVDLTAVERVGRTARAKEVPMDTATAASMGDGLDVASDLATAGDLACGSAVAMASLSALSTDAESAVDSAAAMGSAMAGYLEHRMEIQTADEMAYP